MMVKKLLLSIAIFLFLSTLSFSQTYTMPTTGSSSYTTCAGTVYDPGGAGQYSNGCNGTTTFYPAVAGNYIKLIFNSFSVETCCDYLRIYDGTSTADPLIGTYTSSPGTVYATTSSGALTLYFTTDGSVVYNGFDATLSCVTSPPPPGADLVITSPTATPTTVASGSAVSTTCYIYNQGTTSASSSNVGYYLSTDAVWDAADVYLNSYAGGTLANGGSAYKSLSVTIPGATTPGNYYLLYFADYSGAQSESDETNNVSSVAITVTTPSIDMVIQSQTASPTSVAAGGSVSVGCYIYNQGNTSSSSSNVGYYLSTDAVWDAGDTYLNYTAGGTLGALASSYRSSTVTIPLATTPGSYYILYYADYANAVTETDETNNVANVVISVLTPVIDLIIQSQTASPTAVPVGGSISASCYIYNQGNTTASSSNVGYYLSADAIWDAGDTYLNVSTGTSLNANSSSYRSATLVIPGATTPGSYYILYYADYSNVIVENVETNNVVAVAITVMTPITDLVIQSQTATPLSVASGGTVTATCYIYNQGNVSVTSSNVGYYLSTDAVWDAADTYLNFSSGTTLNANTSAYKSISLTIPGATTPGSYYILYFADYTNAVTENVETNNVNYVAITVASPVIDLIIQSQTANPLSIAAGATTSASCYIYNQGNTSSSASTVGYYLSTDNAWDAGDTYLSFTTGGTLAAASSSLRSATLTIPGATTPGSYYILYFADYANAVAEGIETNNVVSVPVTVVTPTVDLIIQSQAASPTTVLAGNSVSGSCYIYNQGNSTATSSNVGYYLSADAVWDAGDTYLNYSTGTTLAASSSAYKSATLVIPGATTPGTYYILYYADYSGAVSESVETNNVASVLITVTAPVVDLIITSQSASPTSVTAGGSVSASCYIYNQGNSTSSSSNVGYYLSTNTTWDAGDTYLNNSVGTTLAASSSSYRSATLVIPGATPAGTYYILFYADYSNAVSESVETNNVSYVAITVIVPAIDLVVISQSASPTTTTAGGSISVSCYAYNQGNTTSASSDVGYYLSSDAVWDGADTYLNYSAGGALAAGSTSYRSNTVTIPGATPAGTYYILYFADYANSVSESIETNNVSYVVISVTVPSIDLVIQSQSVSPTTIIAGNNTSVACYVYNQGNTPASTSDVGYYLSSDAVWDAADVYLNYSAGGSLAAATSAYRSNTVTIPGATTPGNYYIIFFADNFGSETETIETNNYSSNAITVTVPYYDLIIQSASATPSTIAAGGSVSVSCSIYNQGNAATTSSDVGYYLSTDNAWDAADTYLNNTTGGALAASSSSPRSGSVTIPAATPIGSYYIIYFADNALAISESVETNNYASFAITVDPFTNTILMPSSTGASTYTLCSGTIYDDGGAAGNYSNSVNSTTTLYPAAAGNMIRLTFNSFLLETCCDYLQIYDGPSTAATLIGTYISNPGTVTATNGTGALTLRFYSDGSVFYSGFDATISCVSQGALPDLSSIYPACSPITIVQGGTGSTSCQVINSGGSSSAQNILGYYLSADTLWDAADVYLSSDTVPVLAAAGTTALTEIITIPSATATGSYYLLFVSDTALAVSENVETNNVSYIAITVSPFVGISEADDLYSVIVFPNPSADGKVFIHINSNEHNSATVRLFDNIGKRVLEVNASLSLLKENSIPINISTKGIYLAEIIIGEKTTYRKIIIQ